MGWRIDFEVIVHAHDTLKSVCCNTVINHEAFPALVILFSV